MLDLNRVGWGRGGKWLGELPRDQWQGEGRMARRRKARGKGKVDNSGMCWEIEWPGMIRPEQRFWGLRDTLKSWLLKGESVSTSHRSTYLEVVIETKWPANHPVSSMGLVIFNLSNLLGVQDRTMRGFAYVTRNLTCR